MSVFKPYDKYRALADESMTVAVTRRGRRISCPKRKSILKPPQNQSRVKQETCKTGNMLHNLTVPSRMKLPEAIPAKRIPIRKQHDQILKAIWCPLPLWILKYI